MAKTPELTKREDFIAEEPKRAQVGDVVQSMLTEIQFQTERDDTWVLMDGRDVTSANPLYSVDTEYFNITSNPNIPDARGRTLRMKDNGVGLNPDGDTALGTLQNDKTRIPRDTALGTQAYRSRGNLAGRTASGTGGVGDIVAGGPSFDRNNTFVTIDAGGDAETRMVNTTVNYFIKINE